GGGKQGILYTLSTDDMSMVQDQQGDYWTRYSQGFQAFYSGMGPSSEYSWLGPKFGPSPTFWRGQDPNYAMIYAWASYDRPRAFQYDLNTNKVLYNSTPQPTCDGNTPCTHGCLENTDQPRASNWPPFFSVSAKGNSNGLIWF